MAGKCVFAGSNTDCSMTLSNQPTSSAYVPIAAPDDLSPTKPSYLSALNALSSVAGAVNVAHNLDYLVDRIPKRLEPVTAWKKYSSGRRKCSRAAFLAAVARNENWRNDGRTEGLETLRTAGRETGATLLSFLREMRTSFEGRAGTPGWNTGIEGIGGR